MGATSGFSIESNFPKLCEVIDYLDSLTGKMDLSTLGSLLEKSNTEICDVISVCRFDPQHYQRNKIATGEWYDMLVICWRPGQESTIHDHRDSSCGFKILEGTATEVRYKKLANPNPEILNAPELVSATESVTYTQGQLCMAEDRDIHKISNLSSDQDLVTLHIYSPPLKMVCYTACD